MWYEIAVQNLGLLLLTASVEHVVARQPHSKGRTIVIVLAADEPIQDIPCAPVLNAPVVVILSSASVVQCGICG